MSTQRRQSQASKQRLSGSKREKKHANKTVLSVKVKKSPALPRPKPQPSPETVSAKDYPSADEVILRAKLEQEKKIIMWSGVSFFMVVIIFFWVINTKTLISGPLASQDDGTGKLQDIWSDVRGEMSDNIKLLQEGLDQIKAARTTASSSEQELDQVTNEADSISAAIERAISTSTEVY